MHRIKHEAHKELYGYLSPANTGTTSRNASPRRRQESPNPKSSSSHSQHEPLSGSGIELAALQVEDDPCILRASIPIVHPQNSIDVPPDIVARPTISRLAKLKAICYRILFFSWINVLLVMVPVAVAIHFADVGDIAMFVTSTLAIIPLAALLGYSTEELAKQFGPAYGALLNITFGNATELIVFVIGIIKGELNVVQAAIIGSVLGNLLLVLGMAFFLGGLRYKEQRYNHTVTQTTGCLLLLAITSLTIPTAFHASFVDSEQADLRVLHLSYATSIVLLVIYGIYLFFQLKSHAYMYKVAAQEDMETGVSSQQAETSIVVDSASIQTTTTPENTENLDTTRSLTATSTVLSEDSDLPEIPLVASILLLIISTALVAIMAEFMVSSIQAVVSTTSISEQFVGLIILPIVGNAAEHITAVTVAYKNKMDLSLGIALGSSLQIVLLVAPVAVLIGWALDQPLTLYFSLFETLSVFATVLIVTYLVIDGRSNYLEGALLMAAYVLIAIASIFYPSVDEEA